MRDTSNPNWRGGIAYAPYPFNWRDISQAVLDRDERRCQNPKCGDGRHLDVHHIDYDKQNVDGANLITLCGRCHSKTNFNREQSREYYVEIQKARGFDVLAIAIVAQREPLVGWNRGSKHPMAKLSDEQIVEIRTTPKTRGSGIALSRKFGISQSNVSLIRSGYTWK